jgi:hypothetical protein
MGFKTRDASRALRAGVLKLLPPGARRSKDELLVALRALPRPSASIRKLKFALAHLIDEGRVVLDGSRAGARFRRAVAVGAKVRGRARDAESRSRTGNGRARHA